MSLLRDTFISTPWALLSDPLPHSPIHIYLLNQGQSTKPDGPYIQTANYFSKGSTACYYPIREQIQISKSSLVLEKSSLEIPLQFTEKDRQMYSEQFQGICEAIEEGRLQKAVAFSFLRNENFQLDTKIFFKMLDNVLIQQRKTQSSYCYAIYEGPQKALLGLSPELLIKKLGDSFETMALAGTRSNNPTSYQELISNPKELWEHELVVQSISEDLGRWGPVEKDTLRIREASSLIHLETPLRLHNSNVSIHDLIESLHPTPALGGYPKKPALDFLESVESRYPRGRYGAPFVVHDSSQALALVAIRGIEIDTNGLKVGAGGGIVKGSLYESELLEVQKKWRSISEIFGIKTEVVKICTT